MCLFLPGDYKLIKGHSVPYSLRPQRWAECLAHSAYSEKLGQ